MTPRYPRLVSLLRAVDARQWIDAEALEYLGTLVTWINATGDGPSVNGRALVLTESGRDVLALVGELDFQAELVRIAHHNVDEEDKANREFIADLKNIVQRIDDAGAECTCEATGERLAEIMREFEDMDLTPEYDE